MPVLSLVPFPPLRWWHEALTDPSCFLDAAEPFRKMGFRNRYRIATSNGPLWLTVPIVGGRKQRTPVGQIAIDNRLPWQRSHWRSLVSVYRRTPFFEHYEPSLQPLFETPFTSLAQFNEATINWCRNALNTDVTFEVTPTPLTHLPDRREERLSVADFPETPYTQPFAARTGFLPGMSVLDVLFCEGPAALDWIV